VTDFPPGQSSLFYFRRRVGCTGRGKAKPLALSFPLTGQVTALFKKRKICAPKVKEKHRPIFPFDFVLHSLRHTMLSRLGESAVDAFII
jgi:hypothetical protein